MGFFKKLGNGIVKVAKDIVGVKDKGSSNPTNREKATSQIALAFHAEILKKLKTPGKSTFSVFSEAAKLTDAYLKSAEGQNAIAALEAQLNAGGNASSTSVQSMLLNVAKNAVDGIGTGLNKSLDSVVQTGIGKLGESVFGSKPVKSVGESLGGFLGNVAGEATTTWLKKNWFWLLIPFGLLIMLTINIGKKTFARNGKKSGFRRR